MTCQAGILRLFEVDEFVRMSSGTLHEIRKFKCVNGESFVLREPVIGKDFSSLGHIVDHFEP